MNFGIKQFFFLLSIFVIGFAFVTSSSAYTGTGFSHDISYSKYFDVSNQDILQRYNSTDCKNEFTGVCTGVVDGDTIYVEGIGKIRFVGVNTPERGVKGYLTSKYFVEKLCLDKKVSLDIDDSKKNDRYGRTLAVVIVDGRNLNEMLLKENLAEIMYMPPSEFYPYNWASNITKVSNYKTDTTRQSSTNSYGESSESGSGNYIASSNSNKFHTSTCRFAKNIKENNKVIFKNRSDAISQGYTPCKVCNP